MRFNKQQPKAAHSQGGSTRDAMQELKHRAAELQDRLSDLHAEFSQTAARQVWQ